MGKYWGRTFRELPERDADANRTGVAVVSVLFGVVLATIASGAAQAVRALDAPEMKTPSGDTLGELVPDPGAALWHHGLAFVLVVTSFVGYFGSKHGPQLRIKFFNLPFVLIALDCAMVGSYFLLAQYAEGFDSEVSATPEAVLVALSFLLYAVWDLLGYAMQQDRHTRLSRGLSRPEASPDEKRLRHFLGRYGARRGTTLLFLVIVAGIAAASIWRYNRAVVVIDASLIGLLILYRVAKSVGDDTIRYRTSWAADREGIVPPVVHHNITVLEELATAGEGSPAAPEVLSALAAVGAVTLVASTEVEDQTSRHVVAARLTKVGQAYVEAYAPT